MTFRALITHAPGRAQLTTGDMTITLPGVPRTGDQFRRSPSDEPGALYDVVNVIWVPAGDTTAVDVEIHVAPAPAALVFDVAEAKAEALTATAEWLAREVAGVRESPYVLAGKDIIERIRYRAESHRDGSLPEPETDTI